MVKLLCGENIVMNEDMLIKYYNKFCEDKRLLSRHGQVEFRVTMGWLQKILTEYGAKKILDVGAGTGRYSFALAELGYDVTALELVKYNLGILKTNNKFNISAVQGDARRLNKFDDGEFDAVLLFGPMYHLLEKSEKLMAIKEAKRVLKKGGLLFISYLMADYAILIHGFRDGNITALRKDGFVDGDFNVISDRDGLYSYVSLDEVNELQKESGLRRLAVVSQDGPSDYMRNILNNMDTETFELFVQYQQQKSAKPEFLGASSHVLDILIKED